MEKRAEHLEQLTAYLDGELTPAERADVDRLLAEDAEARALLEQLRQASRLVGSLPRGRAPSDLAERVTARLERQALLAGSGAQPASARRGRRWGRGLAYAACFVLVCTAAWLGVAEWTRRRAPSPHAATDDARSTEVKMARAPVEHATEIEPEATARPEALVLADRKKTSVGMGLDALGYAGAEHAAAASKVARSRLGAPPMAHPAPASPEEDRAEATVPRNPPLGGGAAAERRIAPAPEAAAAAVPPAEHPARLAFGPPVLRADRADQRTAPPAPAEKRIIVETHDRSLLSRQVALIEGFMAGHSIPSVAVGGHALPASADQQYYTIRHAGSVGESKAPASGSLAAGADEVLVRLRIREDLATPLLAALRKQAEDQNAELLWIAGAPPAENAPDMTAAGRRRALSTSAGSGPARVATPSKPGSATGATAGGAAPRAGGMHAPEGSNETGPSPSGEKPAFLFRAGAATKPGVPKNAAAAGDRPRLVTMALSLRARAEADSDRPREGVAGRRGRGAARGAPTTRRAGASTPGKKPSPATTQGASRG